MTLPDIGVTGIVCLGILAFAVIGFLKGLIRTVLAMVCLGVAGYSALWGHEHATALTGPWVGQPGPWLPKVIAALTGLTVFLICRYLLHFAVNPFNESNTGKRLGFGLPAAALSLCGGLVVLWAAFTGIRYAGGLAEIRHTHHLVLGEEKTGPNAAAEPWLLKAKHALDSSSVGMWQRRLDPAYTPGKLKLCKLLVMYNNTPTRVNMLTEPKIHRVLNQPAFIRLAFDDHIRELAQSGDARALFQEKSLVSALADHSLSDALDLLPDPLLISLVQTQTQ